MTTDARGHGGLPTGSLKSPTASDQTGTDDRQDRRRPFGIAVAAEDIRRMTESLLLVGPGAGRRRSAFWVLLVLAAAIASAGVVMDSTATVIGAMIVAPLMVPILGTALSLVLAQRRAMLASLGFVLAGALVVIAVGFAFGLLDPLDVTAVDSSQVASRVSPRLIDLVAALATGTVGAFALTRSDVSDALPGVAIAISLVPPLAVAGVLLEADRGADAMGAVLLFATNATAIVATGTAVFLLSGVRDAALASGAPVVQLRGRTLAVVIGLVVLVAVPLSMGSVTVAQDHRMRLSATPIATRWAEAQGWRVVRVAALDGDLEIVAVGPPPAADPAELRGALDAAGLRAVDLSIELVVGGRQELPGVPQRDATSSTSPASSS
jgi:uncharacterized hydrophobic protein (TIGR00271 family)